MNQIPSDPRLVGLALVVRKYGKRAPGGAWEVFISDEDVRTMSPHGQLQQQRDQEKQGIFLRYFPNATIEGEGTFSDPVTPEGVTPASVNPSPASLRPTCGHKSTNQGSGNRCNRYESHDGDHSYGDSYETSEYWANTEGRDENAG